MRIACLVLISTFLPGVAFADDSEAQFKMGLVKGCQESLEEQAVSKGLDVKAEHKAKITEACTCIAEGITKEVPQSEWHSLVTGPLSNPTVERISMECLAQAAGN